MKNHRPRWKNATLNQSLLSRVLTAMNRLFIAGLISMSALACSRGNSVYSDPAALAVNVVPPATPVVVDDGPQLPADFANQSVNGAGVDLYAEHQTTSTPVKVLRFQTVGRTAASGGFNGAGLGNRALLGLTTWNTRPVSQAEPVTFDAKTVSGNLRIGVTLQIDLKCDGSDLRVVNADGDAIGTQPSSLLTDGYTRFTASLTAPIWLASTNAITDSGQVLVPTSGVAVSLATLLTKFPAACFKNAATQAADLPRGISTSAILWNLGRDSTTDAHSTFVERITVGSEIFEGLE